jgi:hypothetical protein
MVEAAENDMDFQSSEDTQIPTDGDPVQELATYLDENKDNDTFSEIIQRFLQEKHYDLVQSNSLENKSGNV